MYCDICGRKNECPANAECKTKPRLNASINLKLYTVSSTGINASGDGKVHALNSRCPSVNEEFNSKTKELIAC